MLGVELANATTCLSSKLLKVIHDFLKADNPLCILMTVSELIAGDNRKSFDQKGKKLNQNCKLT